MQGSVLSVIRPPDVPRAAVFDRGQKWGLGNRLVVSSCRPDVRQKRLGRVLVEDESVRAGEDRDLSHAPRIRESGIRA